MRFLNFFLSFNNQLLPGLKKLTTPCVGISKGYNFGNFENLIVNDIKLKTVFFLPRIDPFIA